MPERNTSENWVCVDRELERGADSGGFAEIETERGIELVGVDWTFNREEEKNMAARMPCVKTIIDKTSNFDVVIEYIDHLIKLMVNNPPSCGIRRW